MKTDNEIRGELKRVENWFKDTDGLRRTRVYIRMCTMKQVLEWVLGIEAQKEP